MLRYYIRADDLDEEDLFDLDGEGDYEDPESYIEYDQALYYDGPDDYYDGIEQFNMEDMADYPGEVSPELLEKIFGENPASGDELDALFEESGLAVAAFPSFHTGRICVVLISESIHWVFIFRIGHLGERCRFGCSGLTLVAFRAVVGAFSIVAFSEWIHRFIASFLAGAVLTERFTFTTVMAFL